MKEPIPLPLTPLIGRAEALEQLIEHLGQAEVRLLTLTGPGGVGKSRLAIHLAAATHALFAEGCYFVPLAPLTDAAYLLPTIAQRVGIPRPGTLSPLEQLQGFFKGSQLLILDNFEHLTVAAPLIHELLMATPRLKILITSRSRLHLSGEHEYGVLPLALPDKERLPPLDQLAKVSAVALFVERAKAIQPSFQLTPANAGAIAQICLQLDGLPLSLELAAARIKLLPPHAMLARLESRLQLLTNGPVDLPLRQQSLRETLDWSYNLLEWGEQRLFRRLALFVGGCTLEAFERIATLTGEVPLNAVSHAAAFLDKSLLYQEEQSDGTPRLMMLESTREYALERLRTSDDEHLLRREHALYYLEMAQEAHTHLQGARQREWLDRLEREHNNIRAALGWSIQQTDSTNRDIGLQLAATLWQFWALRGYLQEGRDWLIRLLALPALSSRSRAHALTSAGLLSIRRADYSAAHDFLEAALPLWREQANAEEWMIALTLDGLGWVASAFGNFAEALEFYQASLAIHEQLGTMNRSEAADALAHIGMVHFITGNYHAAHPPLEASLKVKYEVGEQWGAGFALYHLGSVAIAEGRYADGYRYLSEGYALSIALGEQLLRAYLLEALAWLVKQRAETHHLHRAAQIFGFTEALRAKLAAAKPPQWRAFLAPILDELRRRLGNESFEQAQRLGATFTHEEAFALCAPQTATPLKPKNPLALDHLTRREGDVLRLVAEGLSDAEIAEALFLSVRTVNAHLQSIYSKFGVKSRTAAVRHAKEQKLL